jgi:small ligand-binding sensory domain FIST
MTMAEKSSKGREQKADAMKWASALIGSKGTKKDANLSELLGQCSRDVKAQLKGQRPDLVVVFVSPNFSDDYHRVPLVLTDELKPRHLIGCSASGLIGGGKEVESEPAVAVTAAVLPDVEIGTFHVVNADMPDLDDPPHKWEQLANIEATKNPHFILLPDPFSFRIDTFVQGLDFAFPQAAKIGGMASGASRATMNALFLDDKVYRNGMVGASLSGDVIVETIVAQGCRPIGKPMRVTKCKKNFIFELEGRPAVELLHDVIERLTPAEQDLVKDSLFIGIAMDEFRESHRAGDFLIRNIIGIEPNSGALVISEMVRGEQTIQFHVRDAATSADDLRQLLKQYREAHSGAVQGALLFSCLGRGQHLYGMPNHDSDCFKEYLGAVPLGGFFCNGEIGPVGGTTFLHGYTSSFGIFRTKTEKQQKSKTKSKSPA